MQQRSILQTGAGYVPSLQPNSHRTATQQSQVQTHTPQPTATFNPPSRGQSSFAFGASTLVQHQPSGVLQQQQSLPSQQQQQQANGTTNAMSSLHGQSSNSEPAPSVASTSDVGLDPNDFPALGSAPANVNSSNSNNGSGTGATSYATQAGTGVLLGGTGGGSLGTSATGGQTRDFTPDDFPALGGQTQTAQQTRDPSNHSSTTPDLSHPPGLNGFQPSEQQQVRQNVLGAQSGGLQQGTPGMLNLGPTQPRNIHPGFQQAPTDAEKQQRVGFFMP
jgi:CCR4-NOT transcription complex subunit 2